MSKENMLMERGQSLFPMRPFHPRVPDRLYLRNENGQWEETGPEVTCEGYFIDEDRSITMGEAQGFPTLHPGTSHTYSFNMEEVILDVQNIGEFYQY